MVVSRASTGTPAVIRPRKKNGCVRLFGVMLVWVPPVLLTTQVWVAGTSIESCPENAALYGPAPSIIRYRSYWFARREPALFHVQNVSEPDASQVMDPAFAMYSHFVWPFLAMCPSVIRAVTLACCFSSPL